MLMSEERSKVSENQFQKESEGTVLQIYKILLDTAKTVTIKMHNSCQNSFSIFVSAFILVIEVWMVVKELSDLCMACFNELVIGISQGFAFHLKIITKMVENDVNF